MKFHPFLTQVVVCLLTAVELAPAADQPASLINETPQEFFGSGDFDGDGRMDLVIVDKEGGKYRLGYQLTAGSFTWVDNRPSGMKGITGFSVGHVLATNRDALVLASPNANQLALVDVSNSATPTRATPLQPSSGLGPNTVVALDVGGAANTGLADFYVASIYNSPEPNQETLLRNDGAQSPVLAEEMLPGPAVKGNRISLKTGQPDVVSVVITGEKADTLRLEDLSSGKPTVVATAAEMPSGTAYTAGRFRPESASRLPEFLFYKPGEKTLIAQPVEQAAAGQFQLGHGSTFDLDQPIRSVISIQTSSKPQLFVIFGEGEKGGVFNFDGETAPTLAQTIIATNELLTSAASFPGKLVVFSRPSGSKISTRYYAYNAGASGYAFAVFGGLPSLADNDNLIIPDIHDRIGGKLKVKSEGEMKAYTNQIPGTPVNFVMVPIHGGEFLMGSPDREKGRKSDEGPQHKVKISPFWMGQCEVTWNEYELFMYPDEERRTRATLATDAAGDNLADAITHPSKPYVEMSFGMGKEGYPAISMTQHAANKYCQWLSAKTGDFYRLPTEAEWEYACRAGTTTPYFFGKDAKALGDYAWYEQNSDFKYQKVGKKKPNPWGLYDMSGNVTEWVLDQYDPDFYKKCAAQGTLVDPWNRATKPYPHSVRGGSWDDEAPLCRSAARRGSDRAWKMTDPQLPKSVWYFSDAQFVGFRIVRPLKVPPAEDMQKYWTSGVERD